MLRSLPSLLVTQFAYHPICLSPSLLITQFAYHPTYLLTDIFKICEKAFVTRSNLEVHIKAHKGIRDFVCARCGAAFVQKVRLMEHMKSHQGLRDYQCSECDKYVCTC